MCFVFYSFLCILSYLVLVEGSSCNFNAKVYHTIEGTGYHRLLKINAEIYGDPYENHLFYQECEVAIHQVLPSGVYIDIEQLSEFTSFYKINVYYTEKKIDTEASKENSNQFSVVIYYIKPEKDGNNYENISLDKNVIWYSFILPIHVRYHAPRFGGGYEQIIIPPTTLISKCSSKINTDIMLSECSIDYYDVPCDKNSNMNWCNDWKSINYTIQMPSESEKKNTEEDINKSGLILTVPVGDLDDFYLVQIVTLAVANCGAIYVIYRVLIKVKFK